jgi:membrane-associated phospholipid phosphatase
VARRTNPASAPGAASPLAEAKAPLSACLACVAALIGLTYFAYEVGPSARLDARLLSKLASHHHTPLGRLAEGLAHLADPLPLVLLLAVACAVALRRGRPRQAIAAVVVVAGANITTQVLKGLLAHPRYQSILGEAQISSSSFPSGHTTAAASIAIAFLLVVPARWRALTALLGAGFVFAVGCSVVVLDWHYPSDVAGGLIVAAGWGFAVLAGLRALPPRASRGYDASAAIAVK